MIVRSGPDPRLPPPHRVDEVLIVGGGFSGTMLAIGLLRHGGPRAILCERMPAQLGRGVAYGAGHGGMLLNVRAANMSAYGDRPGHFVDWLARTHGLPATAFVPRDVYGHYLSETLADERAAHPGRLRIESATIASLDVRATGVWAEASDGRSWSAAAAVLALGHLPPRAPADVARARLPADVYRNDPWASGVLDDLAACRSVVLLGSGLTAVDVALALEARGYRGTITMLSRHGLLPHAHDAAQAPTATRSDIPAAPLSRLVRAMRDRSRAIGWRGAVDELRPVTQRLWARLSADERRRFARHLRAIWDVHRHRVAPEVAERLDRLRRDGRLVVLAGRLCGYDPAAGLRWRPRGASMTATLPVDALVNCTGQPGGIAAAGDALLTQLLDDGRIRPDALDLGLDADGYSRVLDEAGCASERLYCVGALTRGNLWEIVAVPDLRMQADRVARRLSNAHWVGGEGL